MAAKSEARKRSGPDGVRPPSENQARRLGSGDECDALVGVDQVAGSGRSPVGLDAGEREPLRPEAFQPEDVAQGSAPQTAIAAGSASAPQQVSMMRRVTT